MHSCPADYKALFRLFRNWHLSMKMVCKIQNLLPFMEQLL